MTNYKVLSDNCTLGKQGENVNGDDLEAQGVNVAVLVEGGHLAEVNVKVSKQEPKESDK
jgi:hypothetical protein